MRLLITGGAGYIGRHIVALLLEKKHDILSVDNLEKGNEANLFSGPELLQGNIQDDFVLEKAFSKPIDAVFHFAAWNAAGGSKPKPSKSTTNNINGIFKLSHFIENAGSEEIIFS
ncbi:NAD-dependent epimerase/dehydratase family protein, partial [Leptospira borgpetersenii serovar Ballum]|uniref:NAD-dependent epimerase/dehydratase family protein n=1 Tax=Leptospira borgpetersenii TaxID=174 RepID=UPI001881D8EF